MAGPPVVRVGALASPITVGIFPARTSAAAVLVSFAQGTTRGTHPAINCFVRREAITTNSNADAPAAR